MCDPGTKGAKIDASFRVKLNVEVPVGIQSVKFCGVPAIWSSINSIVTKSVWIQVDAPYWAFNVYTPSSDTFNVELFSLGIRKEFLNQVKL